MLLYCNEERAFSLKKRVQMGQEEEKINERKKSVVRGEFINFSIDYIFFKRALIVQVPLIHTPLSFRH